MKNPVIATALAVIVLSVTALAVIAAKPGAVAASVAPAVAPARISVAAISPLRSAVIRFYAAPKKVRHAFEFDTCTMSGKFDFETARVEWLGPRGRRRYDAIMVQLNRAYLADPRDAAVEQVQKDFCSAVSYG